PLKSAATTRAPSRTNTFTEALAMPEPAPVITATLPSSIPPMGTSSAWGTCPEIGAMTMAPMCRPRQPQLVSADGREEGPHVADEQLGLFHRGEVAAARHLGPVRDVVSALHPRPRETQRLLGEPGHAGRDGDVVGSFRAVLPLPVQAGRRRDRLRHPI